MNKVELNYVTITGKTEEAGATLLLSFSYFC
jgi:hypothetical protein